jgi:hypothetical protein
MLLLSQTTTSSRAIETGSGKFREGRTSSRKTPFIFIPEKPPDQPSPGSLSRLAFMLKASVPGISL